MLTPVPPSECQRAREAVSAQLDRELSELGSARLSVHLRECDACAAYAREVGAITMRMRSAPLEQPALQVPLRRARPARMGTAAGAAAVVAAIAAASSLGYALSSSRGGARTSTGEITSPSLEQEIVSQHILAMERRLAPPASRRIGRVIVL
jgi:predicted anti-sigma-YlaC factor YlaD